MATTSPGGTVRYRWFGVPFALAVWAHVESLSYWFVSTDVFALLRSSRGLSAADLVETATRPMMHGTDFTNIALFYRPLTSLSFAVDYWLWGLTPLGYHATNLLLHGLAVTLASLLVAEITRRRTAGLVAGGLFALHPLTAEVVPVTARRQDVLMLVFVLGSLLLFVRGRRTDSPGLAAGSLVAYGLALAAKEPALVVPGLVGVWVLLEAGGRPDRDGVVGAIRAGLPFGVVTAGYLGVRYAVLGGLGGYRHRPMLAGPDVPTLLGKFVLSLGYPADPIGVGLTAGGWWLLVPAGLAVLAAVAIGRAIPSSVRARSGWQPVALAGLAGAVVAVPLLAVADPDGLRPGLAVLGYGVRPGELPFPYPYATATSPLVGLAVIGAAAAGACWSALGPASSLDAADRRALAFFGVWLALPLGLFAMSGDYAIRSGYPSLVPAMGAVAVVLVPAKLGAARRHRASLDASVVRTAAVLLVVVPLVATSPLLHPYSGWAGASAVNQVTLTGLDAELEAVPADAPVRLVGVPSGVTEQRRAFPRVRSVGYPGPGSVEAWLALRDPGAERQVTFAETTTLERPPTAAHFRTEVGPDRVTVRISYVEVPPDSPAGASRSARARPATATPSFRR